MGFLYVFCPVTSNIIQGDERWFVMGNIRGKVIWLVTAVALMCMFSATGFSQGKALISFQNYVEPKLVAKGFSFPEGPALDKDGNLFFVGLGFDDIKKLTPDGTLTVYRELGGYNQSLMFDKEGNLFICHRSKGKDGICKIDTNGKFSVVATHCNCEVLKPNDMTWGPEGRLYFTSPYSKKEAKGGVFYIDLDGKPRKFDGGMMFPNGTAAHWENKELYVGEEGEGRQCIWRYKLNPDGTAGKRDKFFQFEQGIGIDGMKFDVEGNLWIAVYGLSQVWAISPAGEKVYVMAFDGDSPTNLTFGGEDNKTAWVTVNHKKNGKIFIVRMPFPGAPVIPQ